MDEQGNIQPGAPAEPSADQAAQTAPPVETAAQAQPAQAEQTPAATPYQVGTAQAVPPAEAAPAAQPAADTETAGYQPFGGQAAPASATTDASAGAQPATAAPAGAQPTAAPVATQPVAAAPVAGAPQPSATPALVCGILAIVLCGFPIVGIVLGIVAIVLAGKYFRAGGTAGTGKAGRICGIVGIVLSAIMIIVSIAMTVMAISLYGTNSNNYSYTPSISSSSSYDAYAHAEEEEQAVFDVMNERLDQMKNQDPEMLAYVANMLETSFNDSMAYMDLDVPITLQSIGVDPTELAKLMLDGFDYEAYSVRIDSDDPNEAEANYYLTLRSMYDVEDEFIDRMTDLADSAGSMTTDQALAALGQALIASVQAVDPEEESFIDVDMEYVNGAWTIDQKSWDDEMEYFFEFY